MRLFLTTLRVRRSCWLTYLVGFFCLFVFLLYERAFHSFSLSRRAFFLKISLSGKTLLLNFPGGFLWLILSISFFCLLVLFPFFLFALGMLAVSLPGLDSKCSLISPGEVGKDKI